jgi:hypothetical protein
MTLTVEKVDSFGETSKGLGYAQALCDVAAILTKEINSATSVKAASALRKVQDMLLTLGNENYESLKAKGNL